MSSYGESAGLAIADRKIRQAQEENEKLRSVLAQCKQHAQQLQHELEEQVIETARMGVLRVVILGELLKINPDHWLKEKEIENIIDKLQLALINKLNAIIRT